MNSGPFGAFWGLFVSENWDGRRPIRPNSGPEPRQVLSILHKKVALVLPFPGRFGPFGPFSLMPPTKDGRSEPGARSLRRAEDEQGDIGQGQARSSAHTELGLYLYGGSRLCRVARGKCQGWSGLTVRGSGHCGRARNTVRRRFQSSTQQTDFEHETSRPSPSN